MVIYISTFGKKTLYVKNGVPIEVGAEGRNNFIYDLRDNTGINISAENKYYGELTGLYWVWKNIRFDPDDIIGFCHWNKSLQISTNTIKKFFSNNRQNAWITMNPIKNRDHPIQEELNAIEEILEKKYPEYYIEWKKQYKRNGEGRFEVCRGGNMFITRYKDFDLYCRWLFDILFDMRKIIGDGKSDDKNMQRYCAYMGERLLSVYLVVNDSILLDAPIQFKKKWLPLARKIINTLGINRNSQLYKKLRHIFGYQSSYNCKR